MSMAAARKPLARNRPAAGRRWRNDVDLARRKSAIEDRPDAKSSETGAEAEPFPACAGAVSDGAAKGKE